ncbi:amylo-alpha-1,6-glucosidase [Caballeronia hypogeia]|uniref:Amylo-alpha-1,6-glucosidase n=1 Tax=Caballeronia hypogeia TaxID=1777140 RepID=A0A158C0Q6_9BURK|nr:glycogen debranching N-terminal domain-containing protein [Caballeronia hypogeia]SAK75954.1 amylo-alpha-1,6-glucosidase [Caballeronia hypogeia]
MSLEVKIGPPQLAIHQGHTVFLTELDGQITSGSQKGLYFHDTRLISNWTIFANGEPWELLSSGALRSFATKIFLANRALDSEDGPIDAHTISLTLTRNVGGGIHEDVDIVNHGLCAVSFNLEIAVRSDFADIFEVKAGNVVRRGRVVTTWNERQQRLVTTYRNQHFRRGIRMCVHNSDARASYANGRITFAVSLQPGGRWHGCLKYDLDDNGRIAHAPQTCGAGNDASPEGKRLAQWQRAIPSLECSNETFRRLFRQATDDVAALRVPEHEDGRRQLVPAAGLPWFVALFGRDSLITSLQTSLVYSGFARGSLATLGARQAVERDDFRDAEPGKIMHELRRGELAQLGLIPHTPYYGTADATLLYLIVLHAAWCCTGDRELIMRHLPNAERCLKWIDRYGDRDGDGFQEYETRSSDGLRNQGWKDAGDALVYPDGALVEGPTALCELQGYVYDAWLRMAAIYDMLDQKRRASRLRAKAVELFERFNDVFWDEHAGFYAFCLDGGKQRVMSIASNAGHCLWSGIVPPERASRVVHRLMEPDMRSGWGIRTLSSKHPAFNPHSYQNGAVWPHDNGLIVEGFKRYGFADEAGCIAKEICDAGAFFALNQLPELYAGLQRTDASFPVQHIGANVPQAWAAGSIFSFLYAILGLQPDAPAKRLYVDPVLPPWIDTLTLRNLRLGEQRFDIRFTRANGNTEFEVLKGARSSVIRRPMPKWRKALAKGV